MDKEALIKIAEKIYSEAEDAYIYRATCQQLSRCTKGISCIP